jgi:hypothetical protein
MLPAPIALTSGGDSNAQTYLSRDGCHCAGFDVRASGAGRAPAILRERG